MAAPTYDAYAAVQAGVARQLMDMLAAVSAPASLLEAGCGTGQLTRLLRQRFPEALIDAFDLSETMVAQARALLPGTDTTRWIVADVRSYRAPSPYPLVVSSSSLHWVLPVEDGINNLASLVAPGGDFVAALMLDGTLGELHEARRRVAPRKLPRARLPSAQVVTTCVKAAGLQVLHATEDVVEAHYESAAAFLQSIRRQGLTGGDVSQASAPLNRTELRDLMDDYDRTGRTASGGVRATFKLLYLHATFTGDSPT